ncbi:hypothetical protein [Streptomyces sp. 4F14]
MLREAGLIFSRRRSNWTEAATDVLDGTRYRFQFLTSGQATGVYAD